MLLIQLQTILVPKFCNYMSGIPLFFIKILSKSEFKCATDHLHHASRNQIAKFIAISLKLNNT